MTYLEACDYLFSRLPMFQRQGKAAYKANLDNTIALCKVLGNPEKKFQSIHVAGTNGKGSTSHMLASIFQEAGLNVGLYTSPHLIDYRERIRINGGLIDEKEVVDFVLRYKSDFELLDLSFFEWTVGLAFYTFAKQEVDIAIIETGLGGRLDSTNVVVPMVSVITNIGLDHTQFLGDTIEKIASEKAGIIKEGVPVVIGETNSLTKEVFDRVSRERSAEIIYADQGGVNLNDFPSNLKGDYQKKNIQTVITTLNVLNKQNTDLYVEDRYIKKGLLGVVENTGLLGRWQIISEKPYVVLDTAHNVAGLKGVIRQLKKLKYVQLHIVLGMMSDKSIEECLAIFPKEAKYYFCAPKLPRAIASHKLQKIACGFELFGKAYLSVKDAVASAKECLDKEDVLYVGGSTFVVAECL